MAHSPPGASPCFRYSCSIKIKTASPGPRSSTGCFVHLVIHQVVNSGASPSDPGWGERRGTVCPYRKGGGHENEKVDCRAIPADGNAAVHGGPVGQSRSCGSDDHARRQGRLVHPGGQHQGCLRRDGLRRRHRQAVANGTLPAVRHGTACGDLRPQPAKHRHVHAHHRLHPERIQERLQVHQQGRSGRDRRFRQRVQPTRGRSERRSFAHALRVPGHLRPDRYGRETAALDQLRRHGLARSPPERIRPRGPEHGPAR